MKPVVKPVARTPLKIVALLTALNVALAAGHFVVGTLAGVAASVPPWAATCMMILAFAGLIVSAFAIWRLLDLGLPARVLALLVNGPAALLHTMALSGMLRVLFGGAAS